jgi:hypothetical protein
MKMKSKLPKKQPEPRRVRRIMANREAQAPNNSHSPPLYYEDREFTCADCGKVEVWTAEQQKVYFEEWKKPIYGTAKQCRACRKRLREEKDAQRNKSPNRRPGKQPPR